MFKDNSYYIMLRLFVYLRQVFVAIFMLFIIIQPAIAISLNGVFKQGGYITGKLENDETTPIKFNGYTINKQQIGVNNTFIFGIDRNTKPEGLITFNKDGKQQKVSFIIEPRKYKVQAITGIAKRKVNPNHADMKHIKQDKKQILNARGVFDKNNYITSSISWPVSATITGVYGSRRLFNGEERSWHKGVDIAAKEGTEVYAPSNGVVRLALANSFFNGNLVIIDHGQQLMTIYAHLSSMSVKVGDKVTSKTIIGKVGSTGRATGPHLHWGLYWRNMALDPKLLIEKNN